jgi:ATP-dependent Lon protease
MEIPLFPLPNLVLFPQVALPLHIFEERYKLLINHCIDNSEVFGLVLLQEGAEQESETTIHRVGVTARVVQVERLEDGRMNILSAGESRFRILDFTGRTPYWTASVEFFEDDEEPAELVQQAFEDVRGLYRKALELTSRLSDTELSQTELPDTPVSLSYMMSYVLDIGTARKQELLETTSTSQRLLSLAVDLESAIEQLEKQIARKRVGSKVSGNGDLGKPHS